MRKTRLEIAFVLLLFLGAVGFYQGLCRPQVVTMISKDLTLGKGMLFLKRPLHVFFSTDMGIAMEKGFWVHELIEHIERPVVLHPYSDKNLVEDALVFGRGADSNDLKSMIAMLESAKVKRLRNVGIFEWGDEDGNSKVVSHYRNHSFVLRHYYFKKMLDDPSMQGRLLWVPNGPRDGIWPVARSSLIPATNRSRLCNFVGSAFFGLKDGLRTKSRNDMIAVLKELGDPCFVEYTYGFGGKRSALDFSMLLRDSTFTLCPWGNSKETIRLYDAMECGSIPIMLSDAEFLDAVMPGHPFILLKRWSDLPDVLKHYKEHPEELLLLQRKLVEFWKSLRDRVTGQISRVVDNAFARVYGDQH